ncbi:MAG: hypothetical protein ACMVY4_21155 [Minwuia sp.]|uniref:hypothetical protein n=1 Tax=Minwuia sp. TaxID=2493630 RepID=UPI003A8B1BB8
MFKADARSKRSRIVTAVAICVALCTASFFVGSASAIFGPPNVSVSPADMSRHLARTRCEESLAQSIIKRTESTPTEAWAQAEQRCEMLLAGSAPSPAPEGADI